MTNIVSFIKSKTFAKKCPMGEALEGKHCLKISLKSLSYITCLKHQAGFALQPSSGGGLTLAGVC